MGPRWATLSKKTMLSLTTIEHNFINTQRLYQYITCYQIYCVLNEALVKLLIKHSITVLKKKNRNVIWIKGINTFGATTPSHQLNQRWYIVNWTFGNKLQWNINGNSYSFIQENAFENVVCEMTAIFFSASMCWWWNHNMLIIENPNSVAALCDKAERHVPLNTWRNNNVVITSKRRHFDVITSKLRRFDVTTMSLLRNVSAGVVSSHRGSTTRKASHGISFSWNCTESVLRHSTHARINHAKLDKKC